MRKSAAVAKTVSLIIIVLISTFLCSCGPKNSIDKIVGFDLSDYEILFSEDTHQGFLGDGELRVVYRLTKEQYDNACEIAEKNERWHALPVNEFISDIMPDNGLLFFSKKYSFDFNRADGFYLYYYRDSRYCPEDSRYIPAAPEDDYLGNYCLAFIDSENLLLYFYAYDS